MIKLQFQFDEENKYLYFEDERCTKLTKKCLKSMYIAFFVVAVIFTILYSWFHNNYYIMTITGRSMQPTLNADIESQSQAQDMAIVDKDGEIDYGDIIIIKQPNNPNSDTTIIKRVLAFEGDKISLVKVRDENNNFYYHVLRIKAGTDEIEVLNEDYILYKDNGVPDWEDKNAVAVSNVYYDIEFYQNYIFTGGRYYEKGQVETIYYNGMPIQFYEVGKGDIFYLGDNRANSSDARYYGPVNLEEMVVGKVVKICYNGAYSDFFFIRGYYQLKGLFEYFMPKLLDYFAWKG